MGHLSQRRPRNSFAYVVSADRWSEPSAVAIRWLRYCSDYGPSVYLFDNCVV